MAGFRQKLLDAQPRGSTPRTEEQTLPPVTRSTYNDQIRELQSYQDSKLVKGPHSNSRSPDKYSSRHNYATYKYDYFAGCQAKVYFGDIWVDDIVTIQWSSNQGKAPIYGYASQNFDAVAKGTFIVEGTLTVSFKEVGYLNAIMNLMKAQKASGQGRLNAKRNVLNRLTGQTEAGVVTPPTDSTAVINVDATPSLIRQNQTVEEIFDILQSEGVGPFYNSNTGKNIYQDFEDYVEVLEDAIWGDSNNRLLQMQGFSVAGSNGLRLLRPDEFDENRRGGIDVARNGYAPLNKNILNIMIAFGDLNDLRAEHTLIVLNDVHFRSNGMLVAPNGEPIAEVYNFFARDINKTITQNNIRINPVKFDIGLEDEFEPSTLESIENIRDILDRDFGSTYVRIYLLSSFNNGRWSPAPVETEIDLGPIIPFRQMGDFTSVLGRHITDRVREYLLKDSSRDRPSQMALEVELPGSDQTFYYILEQVGDNTANYIVKAPSSRFDAINIVRREDFFKPLKVGQKDQDPEPKLEDQPTPQERQTVKDEQKKVQDTFTPPSEEQTEESTKNATTDAAKKRDQKTEVYNPESVNYDTSDVAVDAAYRRLKEATKLKDEDQQKYKELLYKVDNAETEEERRRLLLESGISGDLLESGTITYIQKTGETDPLTPRELKRQSKELEKRSRELNKIYDEKLAGLSQEEISQLDESEFPPELVERVIRPARAAVERAELQTTPKTFEEPPESPESDEPIITRTFTTDSTIANLSEDERQVLIDQGLITQTDQGLVYNNPTTVNAANQEDESFEQGVRGIPTSKVNRTTGQSAIQLESDAVRVLINNPETQQQAMTNLSEQLPKLPFGITDKVLQSFNKEVQRFVDTNDPSGLEDFLDTPILRGVIQRRSGLAPEKTIATVRAVADLRTAVEQNNFDLTAYVDPNDIGETQLYLRSPELSRVLENAADLEPDIRANILASQGINPELYDAIGEQGIKNLGTTGLTLRTTIPGSEDRTLVDILRGNSIGDIRSISITDVSEGTPTDTQGLIPIPTQTFNIGPAASDIANESILRLLGVEGESLDSIRSTSDSSSPSRVNVTLPEIRSSNPLIDDILGGLKTEAERSVNTNINKVIDDVEQGSRSIIEKSKEYIRTNVEKARDAADRAVQEYYERDTTETPTQGNVLGLTWPSFDRETQTDNTDGVQIPLVRTQQQPLELLSRTQTDIETTIQRRAAVEPAIRKEAERVSVPVEELLALAATESSFDQSARSGAGAVGVFQVTPVALSDLQQLYPDQYGHITFEEVESNPDTNIRVGAEYFALSRRRVQNNDYLSDYSRSSGIPIDALAVGAYNAGYRGFKEALREGTVLTAEGYKETRQQIGNYRAFYQQLINQSE